MAPRLRIAIATCAEYADLCEDDRPIVAALAAAGVDARPVPWRADVAWGDFAAVLLRSAWDYHLHAAEFSAWLDRLDRERVPCWNPTSLVRWNMDKRYLRDLAAKGVATVPTIWIDGSRGLSAEAAAAEIARANWPEVILKPTVSAGAWRTLRLRRDEVAGATAYLREALAAGGLMAQPFLPEILGAGELSMLFFDGAFSHAVVKRPKAGDFRVQWTHGGTEVATTPTASILDQARAALAAAPSPALYARVDGVVRDGRLILMELEQIEPYLYLAESDGGTDRFVRALRARL